jgi:hypothetical protein
MKAFYTLLILLIPFVGFGQAPISYTIYASPYNVFSPSDLTITLGDTIYFDNLTNHNAVEVSEETYNNNGTVSNGGFELYSDDYIVLDEVGTHYYVCTPHVQMGMKGKIIVNQNSLIGQWYSDDGSYVELTTDSVAVYLFENQDCYELEQHYIEYNEYGFIVYEDGDDDTTNVNVFNLSDSTFSFISYDTINMFSTIFNENDWIECNDSIDCFDDNQTIISIFGESFINDCSSLIDYLSINYHYNLEESCNWDGGIMFDLDSNAIMDICQCTCEEEIQISTWKCFSGTCYELNNDTGEYNSQEDCELSCIVEDTTWKCSSGNCVEVFDLSGEFQSLQECEANCSLAESSWNCNANFDCFELLDGSGNYQSLEECEVNCNATTIIETKLEVNIYPNPSSNKFNLVFSSDTKSEILVTNILGEQVYFESTKSIGEYNTQIDLSNYSKGIYNLTIKTSYGTSNHKLILQ